MPVVFERVSVPYRCVMQSHEHGLLCTLEDKTVSIAYVCLLPVAMPVLDKSNVSLIHCGTNYLHCTCILHNSISSN